MNSFNNLSDHEKIRYHRQIILPDWGEKTQEKLKYSKVFIAGAGGLGSPVSIYLAVAGVGTLRICDYGEPELSNLNRQILHDDSKIGINKAVSAKQTLERLNPDITVEVVTDKITDQTVEQCIGDSALVIDCLDNFETRHVINAFCVKISLPMIHAGIFGMQGQVCFIKTPETPCLWCIHPGSPPPTTFPVVGATAGTIGCIEALEAVKYLSGTGSNLLGELLVWDGTAMDFFKLPQKKNEDCPVCGKANIRSDDGC